MALELTTLDNGVRVLTDTVPGMESVALGAFFSVGGRYETMPQNGIAHLVEHMMFKGTKTRTTKDIAQAIEGVGGDMNAYTGRELTAYYFHVLKEDADMGLSVLADMIQNSVFDEEELERERQVIIQEIGMNADTPDDLLFDLYQLQAFPDQPLGAPILGNADIVGTMPRNAVAGYVRDYYTADNMVISAAGAIDHAAFVRHVEAEFGSMQPGGKRDYAGSRYVGGTHRVTKDLEQTHILYGFQGIKRSDPRYYDMVALSNVLGTGMSSRLYQELRVKLGLAYNIFAFHSAFRDDGIFGVYAAVSPDREGETMAAIKVQLDRLGHDITEEEIQHTKNQLKASLLMGRESMPSRADQNAKYMLFHDKVLSTSELRDRIETISVKGVQDLAHEIFAGVPTQSILGPK